MTTEFFNRIKTLCLQVQIIFSIKSIRIKLCLEASTDMCSNYIQFTLI